MGTTSKITLQSPHPNPPLKRGLRLPYSADGASAAGGGRGDRRHYAETTLSSRAQRLSCCRSVAAQALGPSLRHIFTLPWCTIAHDVYYFENNPILAGASACLKGEGPMALRTAGILPALP